MPQILLELSQNIIEQDMNESLLEIHTILSEKLPTELRSCKSRIIRQESFLIGGGEKSNAFVYLSIGVIKGRSQELLNAIGLMLMEILKKTFAQSINKLDVQLTVAIQNLPDVYLRYSSANSRE